MSLLTFSLLTCVTATVAYVLSMFLAQYWLAELLTHWQLHIAVACLLFAVLFFLVKQPISAGWMVVLFIGFMIPVAKAYRAVPAPWGVSSDKLTLLHYNIQYGNEEFATAGIEWILKQDADIVVLQEVNEARAKEIAPLIEHYPWHKVEINRGRDAFSKAIFSRLPITEYRSESTGDGYNYYGFLSVSLPSDIELHLYEIHPPPPMTTRLARWRTEDLIRIKAVLSEDKHPYRLLVGDFNSTIYSPYFTAITNAASLHHAQQDWRMEGTWPRGLPVFLRIGIDHLLASPKIAIASRKLGPFLGSDHRPVLYNVELYK